MREDTVFRLHKIVSMSLKFCLTCTVPIHAIIVGSIMNKYVSQGYLLSLKPATAPIIYKTYNPNRYFTEIREV